MHTAGETPFALRVWTGLHLHRGKRLAPIAVNLQRGLEWEYAPKWRLIGLVAAVSLVV
jgi:hypothetical protein